MTHWVLFASMLMMLGSMSRVAGAPRILDTLPSVTSIQRSGSSINSNQHPKEELELESLKGKGQAQMGNGNGQKPSGGVEIGNQNLPKISSSGMGTARPPPSVQNPPKAAVNMEHPTQSDNDNENSDKFLPKSLEMEGSGLFLDEKRKPTFSIAKSDGMHTELDYTPQDIAEYIFWTGDERGVALALNDFLQDELVTKEDVIRFLEDVKVELNLLRNRYSTVTQVNPILQNFPSMPLDQSAKSRMFSQKQKYVNEMPVKKESLSRDYSSLLGNYDGWTGTGTESESQKYGNSNLNNGNNGLSSQTQSQILSSMIMAASPDKAIQTSVSSGEELPDYEDMIDKIRQADAKLREYSLEEIIYQLAKELFAQELQEQPQRSIQRFAHFVENEAALGHIPKDLSKAVLDTLVGALVDAVSEQAPGTLKQLDSQIPNQIPSQNQPSKSKSINEQIKQKFQSTKNKTKK